MSNTNKKSVFYIKFDWMFQELNLSDTACDVFALIFSFTRNNKLTYYGTVQYLADRINKSEKSVSRSLKFLVDAGYIEKINVDYNNLIRPTYRVNEQIINLHKDDLKISEYLHNNNDQDKLSSNTEETSYNIADKMSTDTDKMSVYNKNNNINNSFLSKSNKLDLSKKLVHSSKCTGINSNNFTENSENDQNVPVVYEKNEKNKINAREETHGPNCEPAAVKLPSSVSIDQEQSDVDKINALKLFKSNTNKNGKHKKDNEFTRCARLINANTIYSDKLKDLLYKYLKFRITRRGLTEDVWRQILSQLEEAISFAPTRDNDKLNYLREYVVNTSLCAQYNTFYPIKDRKLVELLTSYNPHSRGLNIDQDGLPRQNHGPVDKSKLAVNSDGTPMIF